jgi:spermidine synthase
MVFLFFFFSGASGLIYEVVWTRLFEFIVGCSHQSITIVVATFMGGLALGSFLGGKAADRSRSPLVLYGWLVLGVGAYCFLIPAATSLANLAFGPIYRLHDGEPNHPLFLGAKAIAAVAILLVPTTLMGATLPVLIRHITGRLRDVGSRLGTLYAVNTLGAVTGAWAAGFLLIPMLGLWWTSTLAAGIDAVIGLVILTMGGRLGAARVPAPGPREEAVKPAPAPQAETSGASAGYRPGLVIAAFAISGAVDMCLQLAWTRSLILSLGNSTYAFSVIVGIFILGLSVGSAIATRFADRIRSPQAALGWVMVGAALFSGATIPVLGVFAPTFAHWLVGLQIKMTFPRFLGLGALWASAIVFPATVFMGMTFPLVGRLLVPSMGKIGASIGRAYFANTLGSIVGTGIVGFVLLPLFGKLWAPLYLAVAVGLAAGLALVLLESAVPERRLRRRVMAVALVAAFLPFAWITRPWGVIDSESSRQRYWDPITLSMGPYLQYSVARLAPSVAEMEKSLRQAYEIRYYRDGEAASVGVFGVRGTDMQAMRINGKVDASSGSQSLDMPTQLLSGHLPMLAGNGARKILNLGLGSGITLGAMAVYPGVERVTCLEISPEVYEAARFFGPSNHRFFENPKVLSIVGDGRNHLQHTSDRYDIISSEPSNFWIAGLGNLFTTEFYKLVRDHLSEDGIVCQWIQSYYLRAADFRTALRTFSNGFPHVSLWTPGGDILLLGSRSPYRWRRDWIEKCLAVPEIAADLESLGIDRPEAVFRYLRLEDAEVRAIAGDGIENSDLFPYLEYRSPMGLFSETFEVPTIIAQAPQKPVAATLVSFPDLALVDSYRKRGVLLQQLITDLDSPRSIAFFNRLTRLSIDIAAEKDPWLTKTVALHVRTYSEAGSDTELWRLFFRRALLVAREPSFEAALQRLGFGEGQGNLLAESAKEALPGDWTPACLLAQDAIGRKDVKAVLGWAEEAGKRGAPAWRVELVAGIGFALSGNDAEAERRLSGALLSSPPEGRGEILFNLGILAENRKEYEKAAGHQRQALAAGGDPLLTRTALARCLLFSGKAAEALETARAALGLRGDLAEASYLAAMASRQLGDLPGAIRYMEKAARTDPRYRQALEGLKRP